MRSLPLLLIAALNLVPSLSGQTVRLKDAFPQKARYAPSAPVQLQVELQGSPSLGESLSAAVMDLGKQVGHCGPIILTAHTPASLPLPCSVPRVDFRGYLVTVELHSATGRVLGRRETALDISSDWKRFPRYGYLAHYNQGEDADPVSWIADLNRFHIDGLLFYDFQYRHDQPLAGTVKDPASTWKDIAGREIDASVIRGFLQQAHEHNMMAMAYNASYSAYDDIFTRPHPLPLQWATWSSASGPRTAQTAKALNLNLPGWSTSKLFYMNQNDPGWQHYIFGQMQQLFDVYPFDGWHIDTFGEKSAYAFDRSRVNFIAGFAPYIDHAHAVLRKRLLFNAVNTFGQNRIANSTADFVYSELWEDNETFASILRSAEQVHIANPRMAYVIAAYLHRREAKDGPPPAATQFNLPSVLLTDAAIFASGASHIELGDGDRMLSNEYFPSDTRLTVSPRLHDSLRHYYDFLTAYEVYLLDQLTPANVAVKIQGYPIDALGVPDTLWSISRQHGATTIVHLINLLGSDDPHWRDISMSRSDAPQLHNLKVELQTAEDVQSVGWASPDVEGGVFHPLHFTRTQSGSQTALTFTLPELHYWDAIILSANRR